MQCSMTHHADNLNISERIDSTKQKLSCRTETEQCSILLP